MLAHAPYVNFQLHWEEASLWCRIFSVILDRQQIRPTFPKVCRISLQENLACNVFQACICPLSFDGFAENRVEEVITAGPVNF